MVLRSCLRPILRPILRSVFGGGLPAPLPNGSITVQPSNAAYFNGVDSAYTYPASSDWDLPNGNWAIGFLCNITAAYPGQTQHFFSMGDAGANNSVRIWLDDRRWNAQVINSGGVVTNVVSGQQELAVTASSVFSQGAPRWMVIVLRRNSTTLEFLKCPQGGTVTTLRSIAFATPTTVTPSASFVPTVGYRSTNGAADNTTRVRNHIAWVFKTDGGIGTPSMQGLAAGQTFAEAAFAPQVLTYFDNPAATIANSGTGGAVAATRIGALSVRGGMRITGQPITIDAAFDAVWAKCYNRAAGATTKTLTFTGTYNGAPSGIEARVVSGQDTAVTAWRDATTPTAGVWTVTIPNIPQGGKYALEVRHKDTPARLARTTRPWGVGINVMMAGESLGDQIFTVAAAGGTTTVFDREMIATHNTTSNFWMGTLSSISGQGIVETAAALSAALNIPVNISSGATGGSLLVYGAPNNWSNFAHATHTKYITGLAVLGDAEALFWVQGANDVGFSSPTPPPMLQAQYQTPLEALIPQLRSYHTGRTTAQLPVFINVLGRTTTVLTSNITNWRNVRNAHLAVTSTIANTLIAATMHDVALVDTVHPTPESYLTIGRRQGQALMNYFNSGSFNSMRGAEPTIATFSGSVITINYTLFNGTTLRGLTGASGLTGFVVRDGSNVIQTIGSTAIPTATSVALTMAAPPALGWTVDYVPLSAVDITNLLYTNGAVANIATNQTVPARAWAAPIAVLTPAPTVDNSTITVDSGTLTADRI